MIQISSITDLSVVASLPSLELFLLSIPFVSYLHYFCLLFFPHSSITSPISINMPVQPLPFHSDGIDPDPPSDPPAPTPTPAWRGPSAQAIESLEAIYPIEHRTQSKKASLYHQQIAGSPRTKHGRNHWRLLFDCFPFQLTREQVFTRGFYVLHF